MCTLPRLLERSHKDEAKAKEAILQSRTQIANLTDTDSVPCLTCLPACSHKDEAKAKEAIQQAKTEITNLR